MKMLVILLATGALLLAGCGAGSVTATSANATFSVSPGSAIIDTNCTGCNSLSAHSSAALQFHATLTNGGAAPVDWTVSGGDQTSRPGRNQLKRPARAARLSHL